KSVAGKSQLGGEDFTAALKQFALTKADLRSPTLSADSHALLTKRAELAKRQLSRWPKATINVAGVNQPVQNIELDLTDANAAFEPLLAQMLEPCRTALRGARIRPANIDEVILVGGATRMPCIGELARKLFEREPKLDREADLVVVRGAAIQAALHRGDAALDDVVVTDVASHSLGIASTSEVDGRQTYDRFSPIIERNTVIPTSRVEVYGTLEDNQTRLSIEVYEGEMRQASANRKLGEFTVKGIPKGPAGQEVAVRLTYDLSGILEVEATVVKTGEKTAQIFKRGRDDLTDKEVRAAADRMQGLKSDQRERPRYRDLLARANLLYQDSTGDLRERVGYLLDQFEASLETSTPKTMESAYESLAALCESVDGGERW
ncbi:MAG: Hsp70 family protein, partial [Pseudomonadota bacterium]